MPLTDALYRKGIAIVIALAAIIVVASLAVVVLSLISSHAQLTGHKLSRTQAYYSAYAGMNLAGEKLRTGTWTTGTYHLCRSGCSSPDINDGEIAYNTTITIGTPGSTSFGGEIRSINITVDY